MLHSVSSIKVQPVVEVVFNLTPAPTVARPKISPKTLNKMIITFKSMPVENFGDKIWNQRIEFVNICRDD